MNVKGELFRQMCPPMKLDLILTFHSADLIWRRGSLTCEEVISNGRSFHFPNFTRIIMLFLVYILMSAEIYKHLEISKSKITGLDVKMPKIFEYRAKTNFHE